MSGNQSMLHPRDEILQTMQRIYHYRMTTTSGGNLSVRDGEDLWITPARIDKGNLRREDIVKIEPDGNFRGLHSPSSEFPFHQAIYQVRPDVGGIVHAHPVALVAFSISRQRPETRVFPQSRRVCGEPGFAPYALPGSQRLADYIAEVFEQGFQCVLLENHGVVVVGRDLAEAFQRFEALEFTAKTEIKARVLGDIRPLNDSQLAAAEARKVEFQASDGESAATSEEKELRRELCSFVHRGCRQRLLISTEGSFSARLTGDAFLVTPSQQDRGLLEMGDLVKVTGNYCEPNKRPSRAARVHQNIYQMHPEVQAIVFAHPVNATAFSITDASFDARTIPESYIFLRNVPRLPYAAPFNEGMQVAKTVLLEQPVGILENDGAVVVGSSILDAFDRLEVLETTAEAIINSRLLGEVSPMSEGVIQELEQAFFARQEREDDV